MPFSNARPVSDGDLSDKYSQTYIGKAFVKFAEQIAKWLAGSQTLSQQPQPVERQLAGDD